MSERVVLTPADEDPGGQCRHEAGEAVDGELGAVDRQAGEARRGLVVADGVERAAEAGAGEDDAEDQDRDAQEPELGRDAAQVALAEDEEPVRVAAHRAGLADALGEAAIEGQGGQRGDQRRDADAGDEPGR